MLKRLSRNWNLLFFFFQAEDGIRDKLVTGVQTCALPIYLRKRMHCFPVATRAETCRQGLRETSAQASGRKGRGALGVCSRRQRKTQSSSALAPGSSAGRYCDGYSEALFRAPLPQERAGKRS